MEKLKEVIESLGWKVEDIDWHDGDKGWDLYQFSPAGEDFSFNIVHNNDVRKAINEISSYAEDGFDIDEHIEMWIEARHNGHKGIPGPRELVEDAEEIKKMLIQLANHLFEHIRVCTECGKAMQEGYITENFEYFCSDECLHKHYTEEEWAKMYTDDGDNYWTSWEE